MASSYRKPRHAKEQELREQQEKDGVRPVSLVGAGRGGSLIAFSMGVGTATGR